VTGNAVHVMRIATGDIDIPTPESEGNLQWPASPISPNVTPCRKGPRDGVVSAGKNYLHFPIRAHLC
jgi:hypothetical protein